MSSNETAYRTADSAVLAAWEAWQTGTAEVMDKRRALSEEVGRQIYINRGIGFGSTRVVGFERFDSDKDGDLVHHDGCLIVSSRRGANRGLVVPNTRRKAGKTFEKELREYTTPTLEVPGMATFHLYVVDGNMYGGGPDLDLWDGVLYAYWRCDNAPVEENWEKIPMSTYHLAREQHEAANQQDVSGNEEN